jgi:murein DD-endopeptidase MepM/ murein hydrolase activator NlpD
LRAFPGKIPWPAQGEIVSRFGRRRDPHSGLLLDNPGIDLEVTAGTPVEACADGKVVDITWLPGYGNTLMLAHTNGYLTVYAGLETLSVQSGQTLVQGQQLGTSGERLHFEVWRDKQKLDPRKLLTGH